MNFLLKSVTNIREVSGRSFGVKILLFLVMAYVFLWVPDLDLALIGILHHRSIITHSILPAILLIVLGARGGAAPISGALIGLAVHLSCDLLSPMVGFGQIWLPAPFKTPLGPLSYLWLFANAFAAFVLARIIIVKAFNPVIGYLLILIVGGLTSVTYGWINESSVLAIIVTLGIFALSLIGPFRKLRRNPKVRQAQESINKSVVNASDAISDVCEDISSRLKGWNKELDLKKPFLAQKWAVESAMNEAESKLRLQRTLKADPELAVIYEEVAANWGDGEELALEEIGSLKIDLLIGTADEGDSERLEMIYRLQENHRDFLLSIKKKIAADSELRAHFAYCLLAAGGKKLLEEIQSLE